MAKSTYLQLTNKAIRRFNEVPLTSANFSTVTGFQSFVKDAIINAINDIHERELQWPFNVNTQTTSLTVGTSTYALPSTMRSVDWDSFFLYPPNLTLSALTDLSTGSATASYTSPTLTLTGAAASVSAGEWSVTTVASSTYRVSFRVFDGTVSLRVGTTSGGTEIINDESFAETNAGEGTYHSTTFVSSAETIYIGFRHSDNATYLVQDFTARENIRPRTLGYRSYDYWARTLRQNNFELNVDNFMKPKFITPTLDDQFIVTPIPDQDYALDFTYYAAPAAMSADTDTSDIPERYEHVIIDRAMFYLHTFRGNMETATIVDSRSFKKIDRMRTELINRPERFFATPIMIGP